jgi:hypothetical protein
MAQPGVVRLARAESEPAARDEDLEIFDMRSTDVARNAVATNAINTRAPGRIIAEG